MRKPPGKWSRNYDQCKTCGTSERPYFSRGQCQRCYFKDYNRDNAERMAEYREKWYRANITPEFAKAKREQEHFAGLREPCLKRDNYQCVKCGNRQQLVVHHKDGKGRPQPEELKNNTLENLETLCRACHMKQHAKEIRVSRSERLKFWAPKFKLMACRSCLRSDLKHQADGYCITCIARLKVAGLWTPKTIGQRSGAPRGKWKE